MNFKTEVIACNSNRLSCFHIAQCSVFCYILQFNSVLIIASFCTEKVLEYRYGKIYLFPTRTTSYLCDQNILADWQSLFFSYRIAFFGLRVL